MLCASDRDNPTPGSFCCMVEPIHLVFCQHSGREPSGIIAVGFTPPATNVLLFRRPDHARSPAHIQIQNALPA